MVLEGGPLKIGIADDTNIRRGILNVGNHLPLKIHHEYKAESTKVARKIETQLHHEFSKFHIRGEWFNMAEKDIPKIKQAINLFRHTKDNLGWWNLTKLTGKLFTSDVCKRARNALGLEINELANLANITDKTLDNFENGKTSPHSETIQALKDALIEKGVEFEQQEPGKPYKIKL